MRVFLTAALFDQVVAETAGGVRAASKQPAGRRGGGRSAAACGGAGRAAGRGWSNVYGPTETTTVRDLRIRMRSEVEVRSLPIGRRSANTQAYVLDAAAASRCRSGSRVSCTSPATGLARGYLGRRGADGGAVRGRSVPGCGGADVPDRGPGAVAAGRGAGVPGPRATIR